MTSSSIIGRIFYYMNPKRIDSKMVKLWTFFIIFNIVLWFIPRSATQNTALILLPMVGTFIYALVTKDIMQSLILGTASMYILWHKANVVNAFFGDLLTSLSDEENVIMYMSFFLCGGIIVALKRSGSTRAFTNLVTRKFGKNEKLVLASSGIYAGIMSIDDYVSALTAGASFSPIMDAIKKPRLAMAFVIRTFSICISEMLPFGAWGYFVIFQIAAAKNVKGRHEATSIFIGTIPFMFYAIVACVIAFLFAVGLFPKIGPMKKAYEMAKDGEQMGADEMGNEEEEDFDESDDRKKNVSVLNLIIPMITIAVALIATGLDCFLAFGIATIVTGILYVLQGIFTISEYVQCMVDGFMDMMDMVMILMIGYAMQEVMYRMGMEDFVSSVCGSIPIAALLPFLIFVFFGCTEYLYSLNYTLYQIAIPVLMVVLPKVGANVPLCLGALISAGLFGANACVISDLGIISARSCRVKIYDQYITSQPYFIIAAVISALLYLVTGFALV